MATPAQLAAASTMGNGTGFIYVTDALGAISASASLEGYNPFPSGVPNTPAWKGWLQREILPSNSQYNGIGYASAVTTLTATAGNLTAFNINGVAQIAAPIAMTGVTATDAAAIVSAINSYNAPAPSNFRAVQQGSNIIVIETTAGAFANGWVVQLTFSVASTWESTDVSGGRDVGGRPYRVFINASTGAAANSLVGAEEITEILSFRGLEAPSFETSVAVSTNTVTFVREAAVTKVYLDGVTSVGAANEVSSFVVQGAISGDEVILSGKAGAGAPAILLTSAFGYLDRDVTLNGYSDSIRFRMAEDGSWYQVVPSPTDPTTLRALGVAVPLVEGYETVSVPGGGGTYQILPGDPGPLPPNSTNKNSVKLDGTVALAGNYSVVLDTTSAIAGDSGVIYGGTSAVTLGAFTVSVTIGVQTFVIPAHIALEGGWAVTWLHDGTVATGSFHPNFSGTGFIDTPMIAAGAITNGKIATGIDGAKLSPGTVPESALTPAAQAKVNANGIQTVTFTLSPATVLALNGTPYTAVAAQGSGKLVIPVMALCKVAYNGTAYATNTDIEITNATTGDPLMTAAGALAKSVNCTFQFVPNSTGGAAATQAVANAPLLVWVPTGNPTAGNSNLTFVINYIIASI